MHNSMSANGGCGSGAAVKQVATEQSQGNAYNWQGMSGVHTELAMPSGKKNDFIRKGGRGEELKSGEKV